MKITPDTNILLRMAVRDDAEQAAAASAIMDAATLVAVPIATLCEFVWVLQQSYKRPREAIVASVQSLIDSGRVVTNFAAVHAGLAVLQAGGDFAGGAIAREGADAGGTEFVTFDRKACQLVKDLGRQSRLLR